MTRKSPEPAGWKALPASPSSGAQGAHTVRRILSAVRCARIGQSELDLIPAIRHIPAPSVKAFVIGNVRAATDRDGVGGKGPISTRFAAEAKSG